LPLVFGVHRGMQSSEPRRETWDERIHFSPTSPLAIPRTGKARQAIEPGSLMTYTVRDVTTARRSSPPGNEPRESMSEKIWFLKRCSLFEQLTPAECRRLESQAVVRTFHRGEIIYFPSEPGQSVLVLLRGRVKIKAITPEGKETIFAFFEEGELFGEL